jgi:hypothetical protein
MVEASPSAKVPDHAINSEVENRNFVVSPILSTYAQE